MTKEQQHHHQEEELCRIDSDVIRRRLSRNRVSSSSPSVVGMWELLVNVCLFVYSPFKQANKKNNSKTFSFFFLSFAFFSHTNTRRILENRYRRSNRPSGANQHHPYDEVCVCVCVMWYCNLRLWKFNWRFFFLFPFLLSPLLHNSPGAILQVCSPPLYSHICLLSHRLLLCAGLVCLEMELRETTWIISSLLCFLPTHSTTRGVHKGETKLAVC